MWESARHDKVYPATDAAETLDLERWVVETAPDTPDRFGGADDGPSLQRLDHGTRGIEEELDFRFDPGHFETVERDNLFTVVYCEIIWHERWERAKTDIGAYDRSL